jgi:hypothetical protein
MSEERLRQVIIVTVMTVTIIRAPFMIRDRRQRPLLLMLVVFAGGSIAIQSWFGAAINRATGIAQFNNLYQGLWGILSVAVTLEFVVQLIRGAANPAPGRAIRTALAGATAVGMSVCFALTPVAQRFKPPHGLTAFTVYSLLAAVYMIGAAGAATWLLGRYLTAITGRILRIALVMLALGNATQVPFMTIRTLQRLTPYATPELLHVAFLLNTTRFILVPIGCMTAAMEPLRRTALYCYRRMRVYSLWRTLRMSTDEITLAPPISRYRDAMMTSDAWERLHRRVIEIRDSIFYLHDTWAWPQLLEQAADYADLVSPPRQRRMVTIACWLEVTRRASLANLPKVHHNFGTALLLPDLLANESTMHREMRYLVRLHRTLRSRQVRAFAERVPLDTPLGVQSHDIMAP